MEFKENCEECAPDPCCCSPDEMVITDLNKRIRELESGIKSVADKLQALGHETPWRFGRELRALLPEDNKDRPQEGNQ